MPRRRAQKLKRVLGTPALFATAYGNVGSSIYYALGLTAAFALGLTQALEYRSVLVPFFANASSREALDMACRLATERRATVAAVSVLELPLDLPLDTELPDRERELDDLLDEAWAVGDSYGVKVVGRLARGRHDGRAIIEEAVHRNTEIIVVGAARQSEALRRSIFGDTVDYVLKHAPCRVMVVSAKARAA